MPQRVIEVNLEENYITSDGLLVDWPNTIEVLNLSKNSFTSVEHTLHWPTSLRELNLSNTPLHKIFGEDLPSTLETLLLNSTDIQAIYCLPPALKRLEGYSSMLHTLPPVMPITLELADFSNCNLLYLPISWGENLKTLNLAKNKLTEWPIGLPPTLETLNLSRNRITSVGPPTASLKVVNLCKNRVHTLPAWIFKGSAVMMITDNCLTVAQFPANVIASEGQWNLILHSSSASCIQRAWRRRQIRCRLRVWRRTAAIKWDLLALAMCPARAGIFQDISPEWHKRSGISAAA